MQTFGSIATGVNDNFLASSKGTAICGREFGRDDHLVSYPTLFHPFSDVLLRLPLLVIICADASISKIENSSASRYGLTCQ